jgi:hypothetical protein
LHFGSAPVGLSHGGVLLLNPPDHSDLARIAANQNFNSYPAAKFVMHYRFEVSGVVTALFTGAQGKDAGHFVFSC